MSIEVTVWGGDFENALKLFKKFVNSDGILKQLKGRSFHLTRTQRRHLKDAASIRRLKRRLAREEQRETYSVMRMTKTQQQYQRERREAEKIKEDAK